LGRVNQKPYVLGSLAMFWGWLKAAAQRKPRFESPEFRRYLRKYHLRVLLTGKRRAAVAALANKRGN
jgi:poly-beta-1,6-N-acetyl-D-glucosamine synthase